MKKNYPVKVFALIIIGLLFSNLVRAQNDDKTKRPSPPETATGKIGEATITIDYSSPAVKGRKIFGGLLPYEKLWRAGANEATIFQTDKDITVGGKTLAAGKYSFFATPGEKQWTIFFNSETGQWGDKKGGDTNMNPAKTVLSITVKPKKLKNIQERLEYAVLKDGIALRWEYTDVFVAIK